MGEENDLYAFCLESAAEEATFGNSCACNSFDDGVVQLDCVDTCIYCGDGESSSCASFSYASNITENMLLWQGYRGTFQYDGEGGRNEIISFEAIDCSDDGMCDSCRMYVNGSLCNSCAFCADDLGSLGMQGLVVDCENVIVSSSINTCSSPPVPGVFEALNYDLVECVAPLPPNDNCTDATVMSPNDIVLGTVNGARADVTPICQTEIGTTGVWYTFEGTGTPILVSTCSDSVYTETLVNVYQGSDCGVLECAESSYQDTSCIYGGSAVSVITLASTTYFVYVSDRYGFSSPYELRMTSFPQATNVRCAVASEISVDAGTVLGTVLPNLEADQVSICGGSSIDNNGEAWYRFVASESATLRASTCSVSTAGLNSTITVTTGGCGYLTCIAESDVLSPFTEGCGGGGTFVDFQVVAGELYYVAVWGLLFGEAGLFELEVRTLNPPANDLCENAETIDINANFTGSFADVTTSLDESDDSCFDDVALGTSGGIWYTFVGTGEFVVATSCSNDFAPFISMYDGACGELNCIAPATWNYTNTCWNYLYGHQSVPMETQAGQVYHVLVSSTGPVAVGTFDFSMKAFVPAENSNCVEAIEILPDGALIAASTQGVTSEQFSNSCDFFFRSPAVWYVVAGTGGLLRAHTCSDITNFDTVISVYSGRCGDLECVGTDDDSCVRATSSITWQTELSVNYYIRVNGFGDWLTGDFGLTVSSFEPAVNDFCDGAIALALDEKLEGSMDRASGGDEMIDCFSAFNEPSLWYYVDGTGMALKVTACLPNSTFYGGMQIFKGSKCSDLVCEGIPFDGTLTTGMECESQSAVSRFVAEEGERYYILLIASGDFFGTNSTFEISVAEFESAPNDNCEMAISTEISDSAIIGSTYNALAENVTCGNFNSGFTSGVWYSVIGTGGALVASTCSSELNFETTLHVFSGGCDGLECIAFGGFSYEESCNQQFNGSTSVVFTTEVDLEYFIFVSGSYISAVGDFGLTIGEVETPPNDLCSGAIAIDTTKGTMFGSISDATGSLDLNISCYYYYAAPTVWYSLLGTGDSYVISTCSSELNFDSGLVVSNGNCDSQECITSNSYSSTFCSDTFYLAAKVIIHTEVGMEYFIAVQSVNYASQGDFALNIAPVEVPPNDICSSALLLQADNSTVFGSTEGATSSVTTNTTCTWFDTSPDVWYRVEGTESSLTASLCGETTNYDSQIAVFEEVGGECDQSCIIANDDFCDLSSEVEWFATLGVTYFIRVAGFSGNSGSFELRVS